MEAVKAHSIPKHTRGAAGPTGPRIDEKTPTALSPSPSTFHYCFSDQACDHILPHPPPYPVPETHSQEASLENQITAHQEVSVIYAKATSSCEELSTACGKLPQPSGVGRAETQRCALWWGVEAEQGCHVPISDKEREDPTPTLGANPLNVLSCCITGKFLSYLEVQVTSTLLLRLRGKQERGCFTEAAGHKLTLWFPRSDKCHRALYCSCSLLN